MRPLTWFILVVQGLFLWWVIAGLHSAGQTTADCANQPYADACQPGAAIGTTIGMGMVILLWALVDVILGVIWMVTNKTRSPKTPKGFLACTCARCRAAQNVRAGMGDTFECWQCKLVQRVAEAR